MSPTIRIDDEVYRWLQSKAVPLEDNPNSVLRRIAGLDRITSSGREYSGRREPLASGSQLIEKWKIPVVQARFHREGTWYEQLTQFPAALCDMHGYIIFQTEQALKKCPHLTIGKQINVRGGIAAIPEYNLAGLVEETESKQKPRSMPPKANDFRTELKRLLYQAEISGHDYVDVNARDLHKAVGGYPSPTPRMPNCCSVMRQEMRSGDIVTSKKVADGPSLTIRFRLPREN